MYLGFREWFGDGGIESAGVRLGERLPGTQVSPSLGGAGTALANVLPGGTCVLVVGIRADCPVCGEARYTWLPRYREWQRELGHDVPAAWVAFGDSLLTREFYEGFDFAEIQLLSIADEEAPQVAVSWGLQGTPTHYLLGRDGRLQVKILGDRLPSVTRTAEACAEA